MKSTTQTIFCFLFAISLLNSSCKKAEKDEIPVVFDRSKLLSNYSENIIIPSLFSFKNEVNAFNTTLKIFSKDPTLITLIDARNSWKTCYKSYFKCAYFDFGPAVNSAGNMQQNIVFFPVNESLLETKIVAQAVSEITTTKEIKGLNAIAYLLFGDNKTDQEIINNFNSDADRLKRIEFINALGADLVSYTDNLYTTWNTSYKEEFTADLSLTANSSISNLFNAIAKSAGIIKNEKLRIPAAIGSTPNYKLAEAYYTNLSSTYFIEHLKTINNAWHGNSSVNPTSGIGFDDFLIALDAEATTATDISQQLTLCTTNLAAYESVLTKDLFVINKQTSLETSVNEFKKLSTLIKTDAATQLGIGINFTENE
ncbi:MAG: imelysin family protein [Bacteroidota bacterium]